MAKLQKISQEGVSKSTDPLRHLMYTWNLYAIIRFSSTLNNIIFNYCLAYFVYEGTGLVIQK